MIHIIYYDRKISSCYVTASLARHLVDATRNSEDGQLLISDRISIVITESIFRDKI